MSLLEGWPDSDPQGGEMDHRLDAEPEAWAEPPADPTGVDCPERYEAPAP